MITKVFTVYDVKVEAYLQPFYCQSKGEAVRSFTEAANDSASNIGKYPADFTLFEIGSFDTSDCSFSLHSSPQSVGVAVEFVKV